MGDLTVNQAADLLGVSPQRVRFLISSGRLAARRFGDRSWVIELRNLKRLKLADAGRPRMPKVELKPLSPSQGKARRAKP